jgi:hypothetical protein
MGLLSRFLLTWPLSTIGTRGYRDIKQMPAIEARHLRKAVWIADQPVHERLITFGVDQAGARPL